MLSRLIRHRRARVRNLVVDSTRRRDILSVDERRLLLDEWNDTEAPYPADQLVRRGS